MTTITADMVKELREATGAAVLDCKKALEEHGGDMEKAKAYLAEKGLATAQKKAGRVARDGRVETYTHTGGRVGVMVEVNCETDFVAKTPRFQEFTRDITLQIAFGNPQYLDLDEVPADVLEMQKQEFRAEALAQGKPENVVDRIVEGRLDKWYSEACLLKQPFVKDDEITIGDLVTQVIAELQENIVISRFARFELGEASAESGEE